MTTYLSFDKRLEPIAQKYHWAWLQKKIEAYKCNVCLFSQKPQIYSSYYERANKNDLIKACWGPYTKY